MANDTKLGSHLRGHIKSEINRIKRKKTKGRNRIRVPFGYDMAHRYGKENKKGYNYWHTELNNRATHRTQTKYQNKKRR
ncbi:polymorphic toxin type 8 domain-containing protein [Bacillus sp. FJAT-25509]|uniref:polymorphic toxin type 8 domain-containing protein n=1 Tax=Bacillus sp. FJAT-25509 TaxID=1712029 RepID=UPI0025709ECE|nr:polymorphic toxin type 8 domain-containing protein [Bacillus sp. FJAT-25509]